MRRLLISGQAAIASIAWTLIRLILASIACAWCVSRPNRLLVAVLPNYSCVMPMSLSEKMESRLHLPGAKTAVR